MRVYNFAAGPSMLPEEILLQAQKEMLDFQGSGMSVMEMSHRSKVFEGILDEAEALLRELMHIPENYAVLFVQGGATQQFAAVPLNLMKNRKADYIITGNFAKKAYEEGKLYGYCEAAASSADENFSYIPDTEKIKFREGIDYIHLTANNTIFGTRYTRYPETEIPLVADMSSCILSEEIDVSRFGLIYAGAQKNVAPAGLTMVIVKKDLLEDGSPLPECPTMLRYDLQVKNKSLYNTPPCWGIYMAGLMFKWLKEKGGVLAMEKQNRYKAALLYDFLDQSDFYHTKVRKKDRSLMNVPFTTPDAETDAQFVKAAAEKGLVSLKGHRLTGGIRASIYNAMPVEGVEALVAFMKEFELKNK